MKKIISLILIMLTLFSTCLAETSCFYGQAEVAISESHNMVGAIYPCEALTVLTEQHLKGNAYIRNILDNGIVREKALIPFNSMSIMKVTIAIAPKYLYAVKEIIAYENDIPMQEVTLGTWNIMRATHYRCSQAFVGHKFITQRNRLRIGSVIFEYNPGESVDLFMADFDNDGHLDLGFSAGYQTKTCVPVITWVCK